MNTLASWGEQLARALLHEPCPAAGRTSRALPPGHAHYTVRQAAGDWLAHGLEGHSPKTIKKNQNVGTQLSGRHRISTAMTARSAQSSRGLGSVWRR